MIIIAVLLIVLGLFFWRLDIKQKRFAAWAGNVTVMAVASRATNLTECPQEFLDKVQAALPASDHELIEGGF